jgi:hypothetical protein
MPRKLPICPSCQSVAINLIDLTPKSATHFALSRAPQEGRIAIVTSVGYGMRWTQAALLTRARACGRRSRVVLTPRRWRQVGGSDSAGDGGKQARSPGRARYKPLKPLRGECRVNRCDRGDYTRVLPTHCTRGCGCIERPAFPAPSDFRGTKDSCTTRAHPAAGPRRRVLSWLFEISSSIGMLRAGAPRSQLSSPATGSAQRAAR